MLVGRYGMNVVTFLTHHPRGWTSMSHVSASERQLVWDVSIKLLEQHNMVSSMELLRPFSWHATYFRQWHAFIHVLDTLRAEPLKADASRTWKLIISTYEHTPAMISDMKKPIHVAMGNLCLRAYAARETAFLRENINLPPTPDFILQLRKWREVTKTKRQARSAKINRSVESSSYEQRDVHDAHPNETAAFTPATEVLQSYPLDISQASGFIDTGASYHLEGFEFDQANDSGMDLDFALPEDYDMEYNGLETINWEQWDAWLKDSNVMR
jgi:hypothetical protein